MAASNTVRVGEDIYAHSTGIEPISVRGITVQPNLAL
jgi:hypothetical protein